MITTTVDASLVVIERVIVVIDIELLLVAGDVLQLLHIVVTGVCMLREQELVRALLHNYLVLILALVLRRLLDNWWRPSERTIH